ncbi:hypothetical protein ND861_09050 [Leptospira sp. 2 VSF19]|uniref:Lipoprotein n=1 Tax=Leptospira soteropolitanensis TaxID=2950025 RepID=A0AAW5VL08_9LEPT|nr:hypothetical protein [Leptospira soteropolitanensis]MCW7492650.1 hypothetical protein [Leptospira soteropolitanensis]MCW7500333.1 hypothetical protein [Leptospira soteropolitanensis]MCW7522632.1 hypothetical protein [Leptospira soteropolitanensis]MCW7526488.1 hypothetical protein [Leptospira soteropolitanensis]MCW7530303.1 hypothetical protein [Leptospira soteropolitanensis]
MKKIYCNVLLVSLFFGVSCASYQYEIVDSKIPISFSAEMEKDEKYRHFSIETKLSWYLFDTQPIDSLNLDEVLKQNLPNAKKIFNLRIYSKENVTDSLIRTLTTGAQILLASNRALYSQRTIIIEGLVVE